jgi:hypothetical protein
VDDVAGAAVATPPSVDSAPSSLVDDTGGLVKGAIASIVGNGSVSINLQYV